jgi:hypothetical protein
LRRGGDRAKIKLPVKVIVGVRDPVKRMYLTPLEMARPDWAVVEIAGAGHLNCIYQAAVSRGDCELGAGESREVIRSSGGGCSVNNWRKQFADANLVGRWPLAEPRQARANQS